MTQHGIEEIPGKYFYPPPPLDPFFAQDWGSNFLGEGGGVLLMFGKSATSDGKGVLYPKPHPYESVFLGSELAGSGPIPKQLHDLVNLRKVSGLKKIYA